MIPSVDLLPDVWGELVRTASEPPKSAVIEETPAPAGEAAHNGPPSVASDLTVFLRKAKGRRVHIGPRFCSRCLEDRDLPNQRYCKACRKAYRQERQKAAKHSVLFHGPAGESVSFHDEVAARIFQIGAIHKELNGDSA
jgi:hypothetical protein